MSRGASSLFTRVRSLERAWSERAWSETALPLDTCPACVHGRVVVIDPDATDAEYEAALRCPSCGAPPSAPTKVILMKGNPL